MAELTGPKLFSLISNSIRRHRTELCLTVLKLRFLILLTKPAAQFQYQLHINWAEEISIFLIYQILHSNARWDVKV
jgi:hypothetical protein